MSGKKNLLVTGASGFLGGWLAFLAQAQWEVHAVYRRSSFVFPQGCGHRCDLTSEKDVAALIEKTAPDVIIHAAAESNLDWCEEHRNEAFAANVLATQILAEIASRSGSRLIYVSSDMVFDGEKGRYKEADPTRPISYYGITKAQAEDLVARTCPNSVIARAALIFGRPIWGGTSFSQWIEQRVSAGRKVPLFTDQYRSPIEVQNLAEAILELAASDFTGTIHLAGAERIDRFQFGLKLARHLRLDTSLFVPTHLASMRFRAPRPKDLSLDIGLAQTTLRTKLLTVDQACQRLAAE